MKVFIDMDGVLTAFIESAIELVTSVNADVVMRGWPEGEYDLPAVLGMTPTEFWNRIGEAGEDFWASLKPYPWAMELYNAMADVGERIILTSPSRDPRCASGKMLWLQQFFRSGKLFRDYIFATSERKYLLAGPKRILLDDSMKNVQQWMRVGGRAVLVPQPWNDAKPVAPDKMVEYLRERVDEEASRLWD